VSQKVVTGVDGREWIVSLKIMWTDKSEGFEHEKEGGRRAVIGIIVVLGLLVFAQVAWAFQVPAVETPWWVLLLLAAIVLFFPVRWALRRPRRLRVEGGRWPDDDDGGGRAEEWSGFVRGRAESRAEFKQAIKTLQKRGTPARANSPLQPQ
jgi:hypothetical protein